MIEIILDQHLKSAQDASQFLFGRANRRLHVGAVLHLDQAPEPSQI